jgi:hypothetical protein
MYMYVDYRFEKKSLLNKNAVIVYKATYVPLDIFLTKRNSIS